MSKLKKFITGLKKSQEVIDTLDTFGIDVDRLVHISNSQGPQGKVIKSILAEVSGLIGDDLPVESSKKSSKPKVISRSKAKQLRSSNSQ